MDWTMVNNAKGPVDRVRTIFYLCRFRDEMGAKTAGRCLAEEAPENQLCSQTITELRGELAAPSQDLGMVRVSDSEARDYLASLLAAYDEKASESGRPPRLTTGVRRTPPMDIEIVRPVSDPAEALRSLISAKRGVIRVTSAGTEAHLVCRFADQWALLDSWSTHKGPVLCPWFTHRSLGPSQFHSFAGCPGCDTEMESDTASAFSREEAYSVLEDYILDGSLPHHVRTPGTSTTQLGFSPVTDGIGSEQDQNAIDWRPYETLRRDR
jgi:hypothetical protein